MIGDPGIANAVMTREIKFQTHLMKSESNGLKTVVMAHAPFIKNLFSDMNEAIRPGFKNSLIS